MYSRRGVKRRVLGVGACTRERTEDGEEDGGRGLGKRLGEEDGGRGWGKGMGEEDGGRGWGKRMGEEDEGRG